MSRTCSSEGGEKGVYGDQIVVAGSERAKRCLLRLSLDDIALQALLVVVTSWMLACNCLHASACQALSEPLPAPHSRDRTRPDLHMHAQVMSLLPIDCHFLLIHGLAILQSNPTTLLSIHYSAISSRQPDGRLIMQAKMDRTVLPLYF